MAGMDGWQMALLAAAAYVAVTALVRMMRTRRDVLVEQFRDEFAAERKRKRRAEAAAEQQHDKAA